MSAKGKVALLTREHPINYVEVEPLLSAYIEFFRANGKISKETPALVHFKPDNLKSPFYVYADCVLIGFCENIPVNDVYPTSQCSENSEGLYLGDFREVHKRGDRNKMFYETYLLGSDRDAPVATVTNLGIATFRVTNDELLEGIKRVAMIDEIEGEFSYLRDQNLHYNVGWSFGVVSDGLLTFRGCETNVYSQIAQFIVKRDVFRKQMIIKPLNDLDLEARVALDNVSLHAQGLSILINTIAYSFK